MASMTFTIAGGVNVAVTVTETADGALRFDLTVLDDTGSIGDLNALFFDLADDGITYDLTAQGDDVSGTAFKIDGVTKVDSYTNMSGAVINELGKFDVGVQFGSQGIGADDIRETSFVLQSDAGPLTLADIALQDFGVRLTSVGPEGGSRAGSLKLGGSAPELPEDGGGGGGGGSTGNLANDDSVTVYLSAPDHFDLLDTGEWSVLANDTTDGGPYLGETALDVLVGSNGGILEIFPDGAIDFHAGTDFPGLGEGETAVTTFTYAIEGGDTALITVTVYGTDPMG